MSVEDVAARFRAAIESAGARLGAISEDSAGQPSRPGGWLRKQELGHLLDSAQNNHQRIALAAINGGYEGPAYAQNAWVDLHAYDGLSWEHLLRHWQERNWMLGRLITHLPEQSLSAPVQIGNDPTMTLEAWIDDYLRHLDHHVSTITA